MNVIWEIILRAFLGDKLRFHRAELRVWDPESGQCVRTLKGHRSSVNGVAITPDGRRAVSASQDNTLRVWDLESGKELALLTADSPTASCAVSLDAWTIVAGDATGNIHILKNGGLRT
jgi:WD40 repeat protein